mmetsp:Transcript_23272/g.54965  ORF Transcript_23272/g.54965 Transcript_23272/m.54965 type:complete len:314 (+) Transcript_23272:51-992(+)
MAAMSLTPTLASAACWQASFWLARVAAPHWLPHFGCLDSAKGEKAYWAASFTGLLHAVVLVVLCVMALLDKPDLLSSTDFFQETDMTQLCCQVFMGYILQDLFLSIYFGSAWPGWQTNLIHHVLVLVVWWQLTAGRYAQGPATVAMLCEFSTPFVAMRWFLDRAGMKSSTLYIVNGMTMLISFLIFRVILYSYMLVRIYHMQDGFLRIPVLNRCLFLLGYFGGAALQYFWFFKIARGAYKTLTAGPPEDKAAASTPQKSLSQHRPQAKEDAKTCASDTASTTSSEQNSSGENTDETGQRGARIRRGRADKPED